MMMTIDIHALGDFVIAYKLYFLFLTFFFLFQLIAFEGPETNTEDWIFLKYSL